MWSLRVAVDRSSAIRSDQGNMDRDSGMVCYQNTASNPKSPNHSRNKKTMQIINLHRFFALGGVDDCHNAVQHIPNFSTNTFIYQLVN